ncbi:hypothetical protein LNP74_19435 [Klebsiella pneumoniae subsp. pneumoniae]|nr:hypothetical protein [Klebsiella pneumoniae subsp. pneumoniae]
MKTRCWSERSHDPWAELPVAVCQERLQGVPSLASVCIVGTHTLRQATNAAGVSPNARKK